MTTKQCTVTLTHSIEFKREAALDVDLDEVAQWVNEGTDPNKRTAETVTGEDVKEFIKAGRDREEVEEGMWESGKPVSEDTDGFINIERVVIP